MASILDEQPYPWPKKAAQQLHITLCQIYNSVPNVIRVAEQNNIEAWRIDTMQAAYLVWAQILDFAAIQGLLRPLVTDVHNKLAPTSQFRKFLQDLIANQPPAVDAEPLGAAGAPKFISSTDDVTENEALLFRDDLTLQVGRVPALINTLQKLITLAPGVCHFMAEVQGGTQHGTGFRIGADMLLTNWHVLHQEVDGVKARAVTAEFLFEDNGNGGILSSVRIPCDVNTIVTSKEDDWAIIRVSQPLDNAWPIIRLSEAVAPQAEMAAYIIQHPGGESKRVGFVRNQVAGFTDRVVHYLTDTQRGSSGAPVFDETGKLFGLHHAGGRPQEVLGKPPLIKNEGICISKVIEGLKSKGVSFE